VLALNSTLFAGVSVSSIIRQSSLITNVVLVLASIAMVLSTMLAYHIAYSLLGTSQFWSNLMYPQFIRGGVWRNIAYASLLAIPITGITIVASTSTRAALITAFVCPQDRHMLTCLQVGFQFSLKYVGANVEIMLCVTVMAITLTVWFAILYHIHDK